MALFKALSGNRANLPEEKHDGYVYFCEDDGSFHVDYKDAAGVLQRKQINAKDAETLCGMTLDEIKTYVTVQSDWAQNDEEAADYIKNKPQEVTDDQFLLWLNEANVVTPTASTGGELYTTNKNEIYVL